MISYKFVCEREAEAKCKVCGNNKEQKRQMKQIDFHFNDVFSNEHIN